MSFAHWGLAPNLYAGMRIDDLRMLHRQLRSELKAAYAAQPWDGVHIDRIAAELLQLKRSLLVCESRTKRTVPADPPQPAQAVGRNRRTNASSSGVVPHAVGLGLSRLDAWGKDHR
jgi:hypothetical protein